MSQATSGTSNVHCGLQGYRRFLPFIVWVSCLIGGKEEVVLGPNSASDRGNDTAGKECPPQQLREETSVMTSACFTAGSPGASGTSLMETQRAEKVPPD